MDFDLDNTLYFFTAGRYEFRNKGVDMLLEALARLNARLKAFNSPITVISFFILNAPTRSFNVDSLRGQAVVKQLHETVADIQSGIGNRIFELAVRCACNLFMIPLRELSVFFFFDTLLTLFNSFSYVAVNFQIPRRFSLKPTWSCSSAVCLP